MSSLSVPSELSCGARIEYDSSMLERQSPAPDSNRRPLPYHGGPSPIGLSGLDLQIWRIARQAEARDRFWRERHLAHGSAARQADVPAEFPRCYPPEPREPAA